MIVVLILLSNITGILQLIKPAPVYAADTVSFNVVELDSELGRWGIQSVGITLDSGGSSLGSLTINFPSSVDAYYDGNKLSRNQTITGNPTVTAPITTDRTKTTGWYWNSAEYTGTRLSFTLYSFNSLEQVKTFLSKITFLKNTTMVNGNITIEVSERKMTSMDFDADGDGIEEAHYYEYVAFSPASSTGYKDWFQSYNLAKQRTYNGLMGYLATITSAAEHDVIFGIAHDSGWLGGTRIRNGGSGTTGSRINDEASISESASNYHSRGTGTRHSSGGVASTNYDYGDAKDWYWANGPEAGKVFLNYPAKTQTAKTGSGLDIAYNNFQDAEPNTYYHNYDTNNPQLGDENVLQFANDQSTGQWNDYSYREPWGSGVAAPKGFYVEYSAYGSQEEIIPSLSHSERISTGGSEYADFERFPEESQYTIDDEGREVWTTSRIILKKLLDPTETPIDENGAAIKNKEGEINGVDFVAYHVEDTFYYLRAHTYAEIEAQYGLAAQFHSIKTSTSKMTVDDAAAQVQYMYMKGMLDLNEKVPLDFKPTGESFIDTLNNQPFQENGTTFRDLPNTYNGKHAVYIILEKDSHQANIFKYEQPLVLAFPAYLDTTTQDPMNLIYLYPKDFSSEIQKELIEVTGDDVMEDGYAVREIGELVQYQITVPIPEDIDEKVWKDTEFVNKYLKLSIDDTADAALTITSIESVLADTETLTNDFSQEINGNLAHLEFPITEDLIGKHYLIIIVNAKLNGTAVPNTNYYNEAVYTADYALSLSDFTATATSDPVRTGAIQVIKQDGDSKEPLSGIEFKISNKAGNYLVVDGENNLSWVEGRENGQTFMTDEDGQISIKGLRYDTEFALFEMNTPSGYIAVSPENTKIGETDSNQFEVNQSGGMTGNLLIVNNYQKGFLPSTGGKGVILLVCVGLGIMGGMFYLYKRNNREEDDLDNEEENDVTF